MRTNGWMLCLVASLAFATVAQAQGPGGRGGGRPKRPQPKAE